LGTLKTHHYFIARYTLISKLLRVTWALLNLLVGFYAVCFRVKSPCGADRQTDRQTSKTGNAAY